MIADHLTRRGVAVLRYDDRGIGGSSGVTSAATSEDFAGDAMAAVALLSKRSDIRPRRVGLLGHSEGALVAALAASRGSDVAFIVMLAGTAVPGEQIIRAQAETIARAQGATADDLAKLGTQQDLLFRAVRTGQGWEAVIESARAIGLDQIKALPEERRKAIPDPDKAIDAHKTNTERARKRRPCSRLFLWCPLLCALRVRFCVRSGLVLGSFRVRFYSYVS